MATHRPCGELTREVGEPEIADLLASHPRTADVTLLEGIPEHFTMLPERGEGRDHDLFLHGRGAHGGVVVSVEAKVDEPFGETIGSYWNKRTLAIYSREEGWGGSGRCWRSR